jgi:hypothetical protein
MGLGFVACLILLFRLHWTHTGTYCKRLAWVAPT